MISNMVKSSYLNMVLNIVQTDKITLFVMALLVLLSSLADFIGLDVCLSILEVMHEGFKEEKYKPAKLLVEMVKNKELGVKSGVGFYDYSNGMKDKKTAKRFL